MQENYLLCSPCSQTHRSSFESFVQASEYFSQGDELYTHIQREQEYSCLPMHACLSTVLPGSLFAGIRARINFPSALGKFSTTRKNATLLNELRYILSVETGLQGTMACVAEYIPSLLMQLRCISNADPDLLKHQLGSFMNLYGFTREDVDILTNDVCKDFYSNLRSKLSKISAAVFKSIPIHVKVPHNRAEGAVGVSGRATKGALGDAAEDTEVSPSDASPSDVNSMSVAEELFLL
uniref:Replication factor C subunit 1 n=1 Tax=Lygus hesperus TaxID=30085 RepID=A0A146LX75_LYGHE